MLIRTLSRPFFYDWTALFIFAGVNHLYTMNEELKQLLEWFDNYKITFNEISKNNGLQVKRRENQRSNRRVSNRSFGGEEKFL